MSNGNAITATNQKPPLPTSVKQNLDDLFDLRPANFTLGRLFQSHPGAPTLGKLLIIQKVRESLVDSFENIVAEICKIQEHQELQDHERDALKSPNAADDCWNKHIGVIIDNPSSLSASTISHLHQIFEDLLEAADAHPCSPAPGGTGPTCGDWAEIMDLLGAVDSKRPRLSALLPAVEWLRRHPDGIYMGTFADADPRNQDTWMRRWSRWVALVDGCWALRRYLDPFYVFLEEADGASFSEVVTSANSNFRHAKPRLPVPAPIELNSRYGTSPKRLRRFGSLAEASQVASALRSHLSVPGSSDGLSALICAFSCFNIIWW